MTTAAVKKVLTQISKIEAELQLLKKTVVQTSLKEDNNDWIETPRGKKFLTARVKTARKEIAQGKTVTAEELRKELGL